MTRAPARRRARLPAAGLSLVLLPAGQALGAETPDSPKGTVAPAESATRHTVTLITGDEVTVTDLTGKARAGKQLDVGIFSEYVKGAVGTGTITGATLEVSYDHGKTWSKVRLDGVRGRSAVWEASL
ncbi:hypothetical protein ACWCXB_11565 [Streptomyces sp. NPDC001514]